MVYNTRPVCQDTGFLSFYVNFPHDENPDMIRTAIEKTVVEATQKGYLRQNSVDSLTGINSGNNLGSGTPHIEFEAHNDQTFDIRLIQKGGGCENMSAQHTLPRAFGGHYAGRDL